MYQLNYSRDDIHLVAKDNRMNAPVQAIRVQETQEKHTNFTMIPNVVIDGFDELSDAARFAFIKFMRLVRKVGYFAGSINKLGEKLKVARMTINRMVAAWEKSLLVKIEPIGDTNAVRVIPLTDTLWQANTDHYKYAPAEVQETVTKCDTISVSDTSETDTVVTKCDTPSQNVTGTVTKCDDIEHEIDRNIDKNISNKNIDTISSTNVEDALPPYSDGLKPRNSILSGWLADMSLLDDAFLAEMEKMLPPADLSTPLPHTVENDYHSHSHVVQAIGEEAAPPQEQPRRAVQNALQVGATSPPAKETRKRGVDKNGLSLQGQHILDEYQKFKGRKSTPGKATIEAANGLVGLVASDEEFPGWRPAPPPGVKDYTGMGKLLHIKPQEANRGQTFTS